MAKKISKPMKMHVRRGDMVKILSGKDISKQGKIVKVYPREGKVVVDGINICTRHTKPAPPKNPQGGRIEKAMPIAACKVMLICPKCGKPTRVGHVIEEVNGKKKSHRVCKRCGETIMEKE